MEHGARFTHPAPLAVYTGTTPGALSAAPGVDYTALLTAFLRDSAASCKASSRATYERALRSFFRWVDQAGLSLKTLSRADVAAYRDALLSGGLSALSVASYLGAVRRFYAWVEAERHGPNVARGVRSPKRVQTIRKQALSPDQIGTFLEGLSTLSLRDRALLNLLLRTGLRTVEAVRANVEDVTFRGGKRILWVQGKGRDERDEFVILTDRAWQPLEEYLRSRGAVRPAEPLFVSESNQNSGGRLTTRTVSHVAKSTFRAIGIDAREYTAHSLRHTTAVSILRAGGMLSDAQQVLRHASPVTTQIYARSIAEELRLSKAAEELLAF